MTRISKTQLFALIMLFEIGSTTLFALGIDAKQDAWIAILIAMLVGFILLWIYMKIQSYYPDKNFVDILIETLGKPIAAPLIILYAFYFLLISFQNSREFGDLIVMIFLPTTPLVVILAVSMLTTVYILCLGYEVFARTSEIMLPVVLFFIIGCVTYEVDKRVRSKCIKRSRCASKRSASQADYCIR
ncbi:GerAB/ArcD/ProY family transporter [Effusibacillus consociatus]|uniref:GerAB/ArcD/ProY family transporter n=1 Tax=Effusibacillus consociatus TaxID=1117041 RepID=A0ABV9Q4X2_9BACL